MSGPIVYVDRSQVMEGRLAELTAGIGRLTRLVEADEARIISYGAYLDPARKEMTVVHIHPDAESLETHFRVIAPALRGFVDMVRLQSIDVYGDPGDVVRQQLKDKAQLLGQGSIEVHRLESGFARIGDAAVGKPGAG